MTLVLALKNKKLKIKNIDKPVRAVDCQTSVETEPSKQKQINKSKIKSNQMQNSMSILSVTRYCLSASLNLGTL